MGPLETKIQLLPVLKFRHCASAEVVSCLGNQARMQSGNKWGFSTGQLVYVDVYLHWTYLSRKPAHDCLAVSTFKTCACSQESFFFFVFEVSEPCRLASFVVFVVCVVSMLFLLIPVSWSRTVAVGNDDVTASHLHDVVSFALRRKRKIFTRKIDNSRGKAEVEVFLSVSKKKRKSFS